MFIEQVAGDHISDLIATTKVVAVAGSTFHELCTEAGFVPDPEFWVGHDTPPRRKPDEVIRLDGLATATLGEWFLLGVRSIDEVVASLPAPAATVGRLWPEHFDYGIDLEAAPDARCISAPRPATRSTPSRTCTSGPGVLRRDTRTGSPERSVPIDPMEPATGTRRSAPSCPSATSTPPTIRSAAIGSSS